MPALLAPVRVTNVLAQVSAAEAEAVTVGGVVFCETLALAVALQPLEPLVTTT